MKGQENSEQSKGSNLNEGLGVEAAKVSSQGRSDVEQRDKTSGWKHCEYSDEPTDKVIEDREPINPDIEFDVQEPEDSIVVADPDEACDGIIENIDDLERAIKALGYMRTEETRRFIAYSITGLFIVWTIIGLGVLVTTGNAVVLYSDAGPLALFGLVVHYYLGRPPNEGG